MQTTADKLNKYLDQYTVCDAQEKSEPDGARMSKNELFHIGELANELHDLLTDDYPLDDWMEAKLTKAADYVRSVHQAVTYDVTGEDNESTNEHVTVHITTVNQDA
tara:strand:- start:2533 stop:2850 length:318 start_codon:yes stop_codon:yes gene_type:complete